MSAPHRRRYESGPELEADITPLRKHPLVEMTDQVCDAMADLDRESDEFLRLPFPSLDAVVRGIAPGDIWFIAAFSGRGKTTLLTSLVQWLLDSERVVYYMGLESKPSEIRTHIACKRPDIDLDPGDVLSGELVERADWHLTRRKLKDAVMAQGTPPLRDQLHVNGDEFIDANRLALALEEAADLHSDVVIIDHIDHVTSFDGGSQWEQSVKACHTALTSAKRYGLRMLVATQLNNEVVRGNVMAQYHPPQPHHIQMGGQKRQIAAGMLGLYRPLKTGITKDELQAVKDGTADLASILEPNTMGIVVMKHRKYGRFEGSKLTLGVERGRVYEIPERDRFVTSYESRGPRV
jgi:archaellum biogenesis ATPase FlaH